MFYSRGSVRTLSREKQNSTGFSGAIIAFLQQEFHHDSDQTVLGEVMSGRSDLRAVEHELGDPTTVEDFERFTELLARQSDLLLLDEPTNHLDIKSIEVLETALERFDGPLMAISHDRYFLDRICTRVFGLTEGELTRYAGGYSDVMAEKERIS